MSQERGANVVGCSWVRRAAAAAAAAPVCCGAACLSLPEVGRENTATSPSPAAVLCGVCGTGGERDKHRKGLRSAG